MFNDQIQYYYLTLLSPKHTEIQATSLSAEVITQLWAEEDQSVWKEKAQSLANDVDMYVIQFSHLIIS